MVAQEQELIRIRETLSLAELDGPISPVDIERVHCELSDYECWLPYVRFLERRIKIHKDDILGNYVRLIRIHIRNLGNLIRAQELCYEVVARLNLTYRQLNTDVFFHVLEPFDYATEAPLLTASVQALQSVNDQVLALERVCLIYEKKVPNDDMLATYYEKLLSTQKTNVKALRYFKMLYSQSYEWEKVVETLTSLVASVPRQNEVYRYGQELAGVYLYHLNRPEKAVEIVKTTCKGSPLDTSTLLYDAYHAQGHWSGCLELLAGLLSQAEKQGERAILHYKIAGLLSKRKEFAQALTHIQEALNADPKFIDALESQITLSIELKNWKKVEQGLSSMMELVSDTVLKAQLEQALGRLREGMAYGS